jgi:gliding motility-associated-like protein
VKPGSGPPGLFVSPNGSGWTGGDWSGVTDHTPGGGTNVVLGDGPSSTSRLWYQFVNVEKGKTYDFSAWFVNANVNGNYTGFTSSFEIRVKGLSGPLLAKIGPLGHTTPWTELVGKYTATATENIEIDVVIIGGQSGGNDFAIDDVSFKCSSKAPPCVKSSVAETEICEGDSTTLSVADGTDFEWYPKVDISASNVRTVKVSPSSSRYYVCHYKDVDSCLVIDSFLVNVNKNPKLIVDKHTIELCNGDSSLVKVSGADLYLWTPNSRLSNASSSEVHLFPNSDQTYLVKGTNLNGCYSIDSVNVVVTNCCRSIPLIGLGTDSLICVNEEIVFTNLSSPKGTPTYEWSFGLGAIPKNYSGVTPPSIKFTQGGSYNVKLVVSDDCGLDSANQIIHCVKVAVNAGLDSSLCLGEEYRLGDVGISDYEYSWNPCTDLSECTSPNPIATVNKSIEYAVTVTDPFSGCVEIDSVLVGELSRVDFVSLSDERACEGDTIILSINPNGQNIEWSNGSSDSFYIVLSDEQVWVKLSNSICDFTDTANVSFYNCNYPYIVNSFSPNSDNLNDEFGLLIDFAVSGYKFQVFSRWGELLFESIVPNQKWDGTYMGKPVQMGTYIWLVDYTNIEVPISKKETFHGVITLLR